MDLSTPTRFSKSNFGMVVLGATMLMMPIGSPAVAQDIEIIGKDGQQVEIAPRIDGGQAAPLALSPAPNQERGTGLSVLGADGQPMFLPTENARSVQIQRSVNTQVVDGERTIVQKGTAIVVDADGQRREYELAETNGIEGLAAQANQKLEVKKSWMIGAVCQPAPEMIRSQLELEENTGLLVQQIQPGSPADAGGLKKFDVLLYADDQQLSSVKDLTTVVDEMGQEEAIITLTVVRGGEEIPIQVQPVERDYAAMPRRRMPMDMFEMKDMGPGVLFGRGGIDGVGNDAGMQRMREMMQRQMEQMKEEFQNMDALIQEGMPMHLPPMQRMKP